MRRPRIEHGPPPARVAEGSHARSARADVFAQSPGPEGDVYADVPCAHYGAVRQIGSRAASLDDADSCCWHFDARMDERECEVRSMDRHVQ